MLFCDLAGSTELSARLDPEDLGALIRSYQACVSEVLTRFGGFIARYVGDGVLVYFGWPAAGETDAEQAVRAGLATAAAVAATPVRGEPLRVRIGIASGLVVIGGTPVGAGASREQMAIGETPNRAARLQGVAAPGEVVIDAATRRLLGELFEVRELGTFALKGLPEPVAAFAVRSESQKQSRFEALRARPLSPMIGREEELELLLRRWAQARRGQGRVVLVAGEPGIGKSRLLAALEEALAGGKLKRLRYFCSPHHQDTPLYPIIRHLEFAAGIAGSDEPAARLHKIQTLFSATAPPPEDLALLAGLLQVPANDLPLPNVSPQRRKQRTFAALIHRIERLAQNGPVLMLFEDIHWADPSTRELLDDLIGRLPDLPLLLLMTFRSGFDPAWIGQPGVTLITLSRLDRHAAISLVQSLALPPVQSPALLDLIAAQSDGVPLFIEELTKAVLEATPSGPSGAGSDLSAIAVPPTLQASLLARLDRMPAAKQVAQIGSVFGRDFSHAMISAVADLPSEVLEDGLEQLATAGLIFRRGEPPEASYISSMRSCRMPHTTAS